MPSGTVHSYLGRGLAAERPEAPDLYPGTIGLYRSTDTGVLSVWDGNGWHDVAGDNVSDTSVARKTANYTAMLGDQVIVMDVAEPNTFTVPAHADQPFPVGHFLEVWQGGVGQTTLVAAAGVTLRIDAEDSFKLRAQNAACSLRKTASNTWRLVGKMEAAP